MAALLATSTTTTTSTSTSNLENQPVTVSTDAMALKTTDTPLTTLVSLQKYVEAMAVKPTVTPLTADKLKKTSALNNLWESFETLDALEKFAISIILFKSVLISALISIVFIFYGDILIKKYNLELRYPKIANIINLRRKFSRYYLILNICLIIYVISIEIIFSILLLT